MDLVANVLFIPHPGIEDAYHPKDFGTIQLFVQGAGRRHQIAFNRLYDHFFTKGTTNSGKHQAMKKLRPNLGSGNALLCGRPGDIRIACPNDDEGLAIH